MDVTGYNWRGLYTGGDVTDEQYAEWVSKLETLYNSPEWQEAATALRPRADLARRRGLRGLRP